MWARSVQWDQPPSTHITPHTTSRAGVGGGPYLEFPYDPPGWTPERRDAFLAEPIRPDADGLLHVPAEPGLGARLDEVSVRRYAA